MDSVTVTVNMPPIAGFSQSVAGYVATFTNTSTNATSYSWDFGDGSPLDTQTSPSHTYGASGNYTVTLIATNSCGSDTTTFNVAITVGVEEIGALAGIGIYPNPTSDRFNVSFGIAISSHIVIEMFDLQGKLLQEQNITNVNAGGVQTLNVQGYESGMYMLRITTDSGSRTFKVSVY
ncbi:MAG: PKD domain-containing protein [Bacteroidetes bacterium]|nr:MAG: PKD domain-containing protein [Bacteroidota bacterium]